MCPSVSECVRVQVFNRGSYYVRLDYAYSVLAFTLTGLLPGIYGEYAAVRNTNGSLCFLSY
eukprot:scaffold26270_cov60-Attheya_sp.AAC.10